jgi:hypothetical protein
VLELSWIPRAPRNPATGKLRGRIFPTPAQDVASRRQTAACPLASIPSTAPRTTQPLSVDLTIPRGVDPRRHLIYRRTPPAAPDPAAPPLEVPGHGFVGDGGRSWARPRVSRDLVRDLVTAMCQTAVAAEEADPGSSSRKRDLLWGGVRHECVVVAWLDLGGLGGRRWHLMAWKRTRGEGQQRFVSSRHGVYYPRAPT